MLLGSSHGREAWGDGNRVLPLNACVLRYEYWGCDTAVPHFVLESWRTHLLGVDIN